MTVVNQINRLEQVIPPDELRRFESQFPHLLRELQGSQTLISQLVVRVGGSGPGTDTTDLDALTETVSDLSDSLDASDSQIASVSTAAYKRYEFPDFSHYDALLPAIGKLRSEIAKVASRVDEVEANRMMIGQILANQKALKQQIEELEALCLSSLAR